MNKITYTLLQRGLNPQTTDIYELGKFLDDIEAELIEYTYKTLIQSLADINETRRDFNINVKDKSVNICIMEVMSTS